ncbi:MAG TPA: hypothetical protein VLL31_04270 [Sulfurovum sp.]|nr:hypothetical protein [Sulfurovum sp.]
MNRLTIVYTDGYQEHYNILEPNTAVNSMTGLKRYKDIIEDGMLKLVIEEMQIVLIPLVNVRKIITQIDNMSQLNVQDYPGFINAKIVEK